MAYSDNFPATRPVFQADFANGGRVDPRISYSRSTTGTYFGTEKVLSSENILLQSQTLDTTWAAVHVAAPTGSQTAPDGSSTAWLLTADSASSRAPYVRQSPTLSGSTQYTMVGHLKAGTASHGYISFRTQNGDSAYALLDFSGGTVSHAGFGDFTGVSSSVTALGSSWFKVTLTATTGTNLSGNNVFVGISDGTTPTSAGYATWNSAGETMYAWGVQLATTNAKVYDSPTTTQISRSYQSKLQTAASGAARFEHSAIDGQSMGILVESSRTNLITYSNNFGAWSALRVTAEAGASVGPDGQLCYVMREDTTAANTHYLSLGASGQSTSTTYTMSVYAKKVATSNQTRHLRLRVNGIGGEASVEYDLANGTVNRTYGSSLDSSSISSIGNGWYRLVMTYTNPSGSVASGMIITGSPDNDQTLPSYDGDGYTSFALFGAMVEAGSHASSLITSDSGSQTTRAADSLSCVLSDVGYTGGPVSVVAEFEAKASTTQYVGVLSNTGYGIYTSYANLYQDAADTVRIDVNGSGGASDARGDATVASSAGSRKIAARYENDNYGLCVDGGTVATDTSGTLPVFDKLDVGSYADGGSVNSTIKRIALYGSLSDTNLQAITS